MQYTNSFGAFLVATLAMSDMAAAIPTGPRQHAPVSSPAQPRGRVSLRQVKNSKFSQNHRNGALALEKVYLKFNAAMPDDLSSAVSRIRTNLAAGLTTLGAKAAEDLGLDADDLGIDTDGFGFGLKEKKARATGSAAAVPEEYDVEYLTTVQIGSPPQNLNLDFDTGSSDLWVYSTETPASEVSGQAVYDPASSNTSVRQDNLSWSISYGDGSNSKGDVYYDTVSVGGLAVTDMAVEVASEVSSEFTADTDIDGLLGLGFSALNTISPTRQSTFFDKAKDQLDSFLFTADLKAGEPGTYNFGYIDETLYTGDISYTSVDKTTGYWMFSTSGYQIGSQSFEATPIKGIADTGTTLLMLPTEIVDAYYKQVDGAAYDSAQGGYTFGCDAALPDFTLGIEEGRIVIPGEYLNYAPLDSSNTTCYGGLQDDSDIGFAIFGDVALKAAFVVFQGGDEPQLGWASKNL